MRCYWTAQFWWNTSRQNDNNIIYQLLEEYTFLIFALSIIKLINDVWSCIVYFQISQNLLNLDVMYMSPVKLQRDKGNGDNMTTAYGFWCSTLDIKCNDIEHKPNIWHCALRWRWLLWGCKISFFSCRYREKTKFLQNFPQFGTKICSFNDDLYNVISFIIGISIEWHFFK